MYQYGILILDFGEESLDIIYNKMCNTNYVFMFNMRYDTRVMEYHGYTSLFKEIVDSDMTEDQKEEEKFKLTQKPYIKYDMTKVNTFDVQAVIYDIDTHVKYPSLKASEEWYLGWRGASFEQTVSKAENPNAISFKKDKEGNQVIKEMNFFYLTPEEAYEYAAVDALGTYLLAFKTMNFYTEAGASGYFDVYSLMPLTRFENELTLIDVERLKKYSEIYDKKIKGVQNRCWETAGRQFNLGSSKECNEVLKSLNIHTGVYTKNGSMSTSKEAIQSCLKSLAENDPNRQFLEDLTNYGTYTKQKSSYVDNIIEDAESNIHHKNRLRFGYKTTEVPSGRLAAGGDKKNKFVSCLNVQNQPKPHVTNHYVIPEDICKEYYPEVIEAINKSGSLEEAETDLRYINQDKIKELCNQYNFDYNNVKQTGKRWSYRIYGYVFSEEPWLIPGVEEQVVEGFIQDLNVRSIFLPEPGYYWVGLDYSAEEIRLAALLSGEPAWTEAFKNGEDIHKRTAISIWGEENYSKDYRKKAKAGNFGILYGMTARNFMERFNMTYEQAQEFVEQFKAGLPQLSAWIKRQEYIGEHEGTIRTMFGRPIRVKSWFDTKDWSWVSFAKRTCVNSPVQGSGADILKWAFIRLFNLFYNNPKTGPLTDLIRFKCTVHDEIDFQIIKHKDTFDKVLKNAIACMRFQLPGWPFPLELGLSIGNRWGQSVDFNFDTTTYKVTGPAGDPISDKDIYKSLGIKEQKIQEEEKSDKEVIEDIQNFIIEY